MRNVIVAAMLIAGCTGSQYYWIAHTPPRRPSANAAETYKRAVRAFEANGVGVAQKDQEAGLVISELQPGMQDCWRYRVQIDATEFQVLADCSSSCERYTRCQADSAGKAPRRNAEMANRLANEIAGQ